MPNVETWQIVGCKLFVILKQLDFVSIGQDYDRKERPLEIFTSFEGHSESSSRARRYGCRRLICSENTKGGSSNNDEQRSSTTLLFQKYTCDGELTTLTG